MMTTAMARLILLTAAPWHYGAQGVGADLTRGFRAARRTIGFGGARVVVGLSTTRGEEKVRTPCASKSMTV
jgi:hypothetical protein